ncbi:carbonic anhydrase 2-like [Anastrepha obliqua]|uniref:carbonic anhydrase 2-like n=1 Tax=Anastrepha obliqua TaxID=95512 RepID=UPI00240A9066|nr:carbonic anhydrase 2-like [Anastrepha obliqua]
MVWALSLRGGVGKWKRFSNAICVERIRINNSKDSKTARPIMERKSPQFDYCDPSRWSDEFPTCGGLSQSPINLDNFNSQAGSLGPLIFKNYAKPFAQPLRLVNNGRTATIRIPETSRGPYPTVTGGLLRDVYEAQSVHFHWGSPTGDKGSEHAINGRRYDVELHIVHKNMKYGNREEARRHPDGVAVLAIMLEIVDNPKQVYPGLNKVFNKLPRIVVAGTNATVNEQLTLSHFLGDVDTKNFYAYKGSLTTPPCSEAVTWHVFPKPLLISRDMISKFFQLRQDNGTPIINNFRPLQPLNGRAVYRRKGGR